MPRPNKLGLPHTVFNTNIPIPWMVFLAKEANRLSMESDKVISIADLIREAVFEKYPDLPPTRLGIDGKERKTNEEDILSV